MLGIRLHLTRETPIDGCKSTSNASTHRQLVTLGVLKRMLRLSNGLVRTKITTYILQIPN